MIYEFRTYDLKPRSVPEFEKRFGAMLDARLEFSKLFGFWHTEVGPLNQIVDIWPYKDLNERNLIREKASASKKWPPDIAEFYLNVRSEVFAPAPFMKESPKSNIGPIFEMRTYTYASGAIPLVLDAWGKAIEEREKLSPLVGCWHSVFGNLNRFVHMWAYKSFDERYGVREEARSKGIWPPPSGVAPLAQENKLMMPASFSPLQ